MDFNDHGKIGGWTLNSLTLDSTSSEFYVVGTAANSGKIYANDVLASFNDLGKPGNWQLKMITADSSGNLWAVGTLGNVGKMVGNGFQDQGNMGGWKLKMLTFDPDGIIWCVGVNGNVGKWNGTSWEDQGNLGNWMLDWIAFDTSNAGQIYCVGTANNLGLYDQNAKTMKDLNSTWQLKTAIVQQNPHRLVAVGMAGNVGTSSL